MEQLPLWITPALVLGLFAWVRFMFRDLKENLTARMTDLKTDTAKRIGDLKTDTAKRIDDLKTDMNGRFAETNRRFESLGGEMNQRFDQVNRELADNRERMAKLEGALEGFLAGRRDRDAA